MLPEGFLWTFFEKAIANDSFTNKPYSKEEDIFLKILQVLASTENNAVKLIERLIKKVGTQNSQMLLEFFYERIHGNNFIEFGKIVNNAWRKTRFVDYSSETNTEFASTNGPKLLPYHSEKLAGFFFSNLSASFEGNPKNKDERFLRFKFDTGKTRKVPEILPDGTPVDIDEGIIEYYYYHPFYPVKIKNADEDNQNQETAIKLDAIVPAFMLFANSNQQFWNNVIKSGEYALDIGVIALSYGTLSGLAAAEVITTLAVARGIGAASAITSSVANIVLKLANAEDSVLGQAFCEYLFWIEMLSLSGELTLAIRNGLKRSATKLVEKEEDFAKLEKQLDEAIAKDGNKVRKLTSIEKDEILNEIEEAAELKKSVTPEGEGRPKRTRRSNSKNSLKNENIERYENFLSKWSLKPIKNIPKYIIVEAIKGYTKHMDEVARLLEENKMFIRIESEENFSGIFEDLATSEQLEQGIEGVTAFAYKNIMYFNEANFPDELLDFLSHEASHTRDYILKKELELQGKSKKEIKQIIGNLWDQEERAYSRQVDWQKSTGKNQCLKPKKNKQIIFKHYIRSMKTSEKIISELINYVNNSKLPQFLITIEQKIGHVHLSHIIAELLFWQRTVYRNPSYLQNWNYFNKDQFFLKEQEIGKDIYIKVITESSDLNKIFYLSEDKIVLNSKLSIEEIKIFRKQINDLLEINLRT